MLSSGVMGIFFRTVQSLALSVVMAGHSPSKTGVNALMTRPSTSSAVSAISEAWL
jgi:hypothetical protein